MYVCVAVVAHLGGDCHREGADESSHGQAFGFGLAQLLLPRWEVEAFGFGLDQLLLPSWEVGAFGLRLDQLRLPRWEEA